MKVNRHLLKTEPLYNVKFKHDVLYAVKLVKAYKTDNGLHFTAEIVKGDDKGKLTTVAKKDLTIIK